MSKEEIQSYLGSTAYATLIVASEKGGARKTSSASNLVFLSREAGIKTLVTEIDQQRRLSRVYPEITKSIELPDVKSMNDSTTADTRALAPFFVRMTSSQDGLHIVDTGANLGERITQGIVRSQLTRGLKPDHRICIAIMLDEQPDTIALSARSVALWQAAIPDADIVIVQPSEELDIDEKSLPGQTAKDYRRYIAPHRGRRMVFPTFTSDMLRVYRHFSGDLRKLLTCSEDEVGRASVPAAEQARLNPDEAYWIGTQIVHEFELFVSKIQQEAGRELGMTFPG